MSTTVPTLKFGVTCKDVVAAASRVKPFIHKTPVLTSSFLDSIAGCQLYFKAENFQKTGSFKARGACNAVLKLKEDSVSGGTSVNGVVTHSSGNHGQAVAYASKCAGYPCSVVVPKGSPTVKCEAIKSYGANLVFCEPTPAARKQAADDIVKETGYKLVHPYDDYSVLAGQGTIAAELHEQVPNLDAILVPIGGGGMTSGIAVATKGIRPECKVFAVEPSGKFLESSLVANRRLWSNPPQFVNTVADAIRTQQVGDLTFPILCELIESEVFTVADDQMIEGIKMAFQRMKVVIEAASGAAVYAAVHKLKQTHPHVKKAGIILCGGNIAFEALADLQKLLTTTEYT